MVAIVTRALRYLAFMERIQVSDDEIPELFLDSVYPIKQFFLMLEPQLIELRKSDLKLKSKLDRFFSMITKEIDVPKTLRAYKLLKSIPIN